MSKHEQAQAQAAKPDDILYYYIGGGAFYDGIPARHLTRADCDMYDADTLQYLILSGLYIKAEIGEVA